MIKQSPKLTHSLTFRVNNKALVIQIGQSADKTQSSNTDEKCNGTTEKICVVISCTTVN